MAKRKRARKRVCRTAKGKFTKCRGGALSGARRRRRRRR